MTHSVADFTSSLAAWSTFATAVATLLLFLAGCIAAVVAYRQLSEARDSRRAQAQPNVVAYVEFVESGTGEPNVYNFVLENFGLTAAHDVTVEPPALPRMTYLGEDTGLFTIPPIPYLAPGQTWRAAWETAHGIRTAIDGDVSKLNTLFYTVKFTETRGKERIAHEAPGAVDWRAMTLQARVRTTSTKSVESRAKQAVDALQEIARQTGALAVAARDHREQ